MWKEESVRSIINIVRDVEERECSVHNQHLDRQRSAGKVDRMPTPYHQRRHSLHPSLPPFIPPSLPPSPRPSSRYTCIHVRGRSEEVRYLLYPSSLHIAHHGLLLREEGRAHVEDHGAWRKGGREGGRKGGRDTKMWGDMLSSRLSSPPCFSAFSTT